MSGDGDMRGTPGVFNSSSESTDLQVGLAIVLGICIVWWMLMGWAAWSFIQWCRS